MTTTFSLILAALIGACPFAIAWLSSRANTTFPELSEVREAYPVINTVLKMAAQATDDHTLLGLVADAAYIFWNGQESITEQRVKDLTAASVFHFDKYKYFQTKFGELPPETIAQGAAIAKKLFAEKPLQS
jgi:hypothetical protein